MSEFDFVFDKKKKKIKETSVQDPIIKLLRDEGAKVLKIHGHLMQQSGWPDTYIAHPKWTGWIEFKGPKTPIDLLQKIRSKDLRDRGVKAMILRINSNGDVFRVDCNDSNIGYGIKDFNNNTIFKFLHFFSDLEE